MKRRRRLIPAWPAWDMPSDPIKAVFWFFHWTLQVLARFFWIPVLAGVVYESIINGIIGGIVTLLIGLGVWLGIAIVLFFFNISTNIAHTVSEVGRMQQGFAARRPNFPNLSSNVEPDINDDRIVEGTVTDLEEERRKRRRE